MHQAIRSRCIALAACRSRNVGLSRHPQSCQPCAKPQLSRAPHQTALDNSVCEPHLLGSDVQEGVQLHLGFTCCVYAPLQALKAPGSEV